MTIRPLHHHAGYRDVVVSRLRSLVGLLALALTTACANGAEAGRLAAPVTVAFDNPLNLIVLEAKIGGQGPLRFILDSGATSSVLDADLAQRLGLDTGRAVTRRGTAADSQVTIAPISGGVDFLLAPGFGVHVERVLAAPFAETSWIMMGEQIDGILGSAIFRRYVIEVDYAQRAVTFHDADRYRYNGDGSVLDIDFPQTLPHLPFIQMTIVNGEHRLVDMPILVDSGGQTMGAASVARRAEWDGLVTPENRVFDALGATGLSNDVEGTTHASFVTRMDRLFLGPLAFDGPLIGYSDGGPDVAVMGAFLLHRFTVIFDYARQQLILEPNADFDQPLMGDSSGVFLVSSRDVEGAFEVMFVADGTPGHEAGLARGDVILAIDGIASAQHTLNDARQMFCHHKTYRLEVRRGDRTFEIVMKTRPLFNR